MKICADSPKPGNFAVMFADISPRKQDAEQLLLASTFPLQIPNPLLRISGKGQVLFANSSCGELLTCWNIREIDWLPEEWKNRIAESIRQMGMYWLLINEPPKVS